MTTQPKSKYAMRKKKYSYKSPYDGKLYTIKEIAEQTGLKTGKLGRRAREGLRGFALWSTDVYKAKSLWDQARYKNPEDGKRYSINQIAEMTGVMPNAVKTRIRKGESGEALFRQRGAPDARNNPCIEDPLDLIETRTATDIRRALEALPSPTRYETEILAGANSGEVHLYSPPRR